LKIRFGDFETRTRARTLPMPTDVSTVVLATARELLDEFDVTRGVRLLGVSCAQFGDAEPGIAQPMLALDDPVGVEHERTERRAAVERAVDGVRNRFGSSAVRPAALVESDRVDGT